MENTIEIQKKSRPVVLVFAIIFLLVIAVVATWLLVGLVFPMLDGFWNLKITAIVIVIILPIWVIYLIIQQSIKTKPGLTISKDGVTDFSNMFGVGFIPWSDITSIKEGENGFKQKLIVIMVKNPDTYINKASRFRASLQAQHIQFGSPIVISASILEYDTQELVSMLKDRVKSVA
ncbi:MAG: STM3941 family protein [Clostridiaceae bacterium]